MVQRPPWIVVSGDTVEERVKGKEGLTTTYWGQDRKRSRHKGCDRERELEWCRVVSVERTDEGKRSFHTEKCQVYECPVIEHTQDNRSRGAALGAHLNALVASHSPNNCLGYKWCHTREVESCRMRNIRPEFIKRDRGLLTQNPTRTAVLKIQNMLHQTPACVRAERRRKS